MNKTFISIVGGLIVGLVISFFTLDYNGLTIVHHNQAGEVEKVINELDFNLLSNSLLIVIASIIVIYILLRLKDEKAKK